MTKLDRIAESAAGVAPAWADLAPSKRSEVLLALASAVESAGDELVAIAQDETGLAEARLRGELSRTIVQAQLFADVVRRGDYLDVRIDSHDPDFVLGVRADIRRYLVSLGPVLNFAASNFPFAFSVFGGDTVSALAAGCPVIVKLHSGHRELGHRTVEVLRTALNEAGQPEDVLQGVSGQEEGVALLRDARIQAASFTGSTPVGKYLAEVAAARPIPIPFYGELGSVNPTFVLPGALEQNFDGIAAGLAASVSGSAGQLCTKPGFVFVPRNSDWEDALQAAFATATPHRLLTPSISGTYRDSAEALRSMNGVSVVISGEERTESDLVWATPTVVRVDADFLAAHADLAEETFGPFTVLVEYDSVDQATKVASELFPGNLTSTVHAVETDDQADVRTLLDWSALHAGRVVFGGWPTGVAVTAAQQHGGPWPATTNDRTTSVGTAAIERFLRPVAFQSVPEGLLPEPLQDANPWQVPQLRDVDGPSSEWGRR